MITEATRSQKETRRPRGARQSLMKGLGRDASDSQIHLRLTYLPLDDEILERVGPAADAKEQAAAAPPTAAAEREPQLASSSSGVGDGVEVPRVPVTVLAGAEALSGAAPRPVVNGPGPGLAAPVPAVAVGSLEPAGAVASRGAEYREMLKSGILYVTVKEAYGLRKKKPLLNQRWELKVFVGSRGVKAVHSDISRIVTGRGRDASFNEKFEFMIGSEEVDDTEHILQVELHEVRYIHQLAGNVQVPLKEIIQARRADKVWPLAGAPEGNLHMVLEWVGVMEG